MKVWKYELSRTCTITVPCNSEIAHVGEQSDELYVWVVHYADNQPMVTRKLFVLGTGHSYTQPTPDGFLEVDFIGTVQMRSGLVFHVFEDLRDDDPAT